jgi:hypothetical protein
LSVTGELFIRTGEEVLRVLREIESEMPEPIKGLVREPGIACCSALSGHGPHVFLV